MAFQPTVSIIIPSFNHSLFLEKRINSVLNQSYLDFEIILLDDASDDGSIEILKKYALDPRVSHFIINETNGGSTYKQWNKGLELAKGELIWIAESDDWSDFNFLKDIVPLFADPDIVLAYSASLNVNANDEIIELNDWNNYLSNTHWNNSFSTYGNVEIRNFLVYRNTIYNASSVVFRKNRYTEVGGVNTNLRYAADWLLWTKIINNKKLAFISAPLNHFRQHQNTTRHVKSLTEELNRLNEIETTYQEIIRICDTKPPILSTYKYHWIFNNLVINRSKFKKNIKFYLPTKSKLLCIIFYLKLFSQISKSAFRRISNLKYKTLT